MLNRNCATSPEGMQTKPSLLRFLCLTESSSIKTLSLHPRSTLCHVMFLQLNSNLKIAEVTVGSMT